MGIGFWTRVRFSSAPPKNTAEKDTFSAVFFYPSRRLGISSPHEVWWISSALWAVYHHASACIFLRLDDIQNFVLMICNSFGIDDIHAFGVIRIRECEKLLNCYAKYDIIFFERSSRKRLFLFVLCSPVGRKVLIIS